MKTSIYPGDPLFKQKAQKEGWRYPFSINPEPTNLQDLKNIICKARPSVTETQFSSTWRIQFVADLSKAVNEEKVRQDFLPQLLGANDCVYAQNLNCSAIEKNVQELARPRPDHIEGVRSDQIAPLISDELKAFVVPSNQESAPCLPNFFVECKKHGDNKLIDQIVNDGVMGARCFDKVLPLASTGGGRAHTICITFVADTASVSLYCAHAIDQASKKRKRGSNGTEYILTFLKVYSLLTDFIDAVTALRNLREWAETQRADLLKALQSRRKRKPTGIRGARRKTGRGRKEQTVVDAAGLNE